MKLEWQFRGDDSWVLGEKLRGFVRNMRGEVYFDKDCQSREGGWKWRAILSVDPVEGIESVNGITANIYWAVRAVEEALGIYNEGKE